MPFKSCHIRTLSPSTSLRDHGAEGSTKCNDFPEFRLRSATRKSEGLIAQYPVHIIIHKFVKAFDMGISVHCLAKVESQRSKVALYLVFILFLR